MLDALLITGWVLGAAACYMPWAFHFATLALTKGRGRKINEALRR